LDKSRKARDFHSGWKGGDHLGLSWATDAALAIANDDAASASLKLSFSTRLRLLLAGLHGFPTTLLHVFSMSGKRSRATYEADLQAQQSPFVVFGTALPPLDPDVRDDGSYVPVWKQEVRDERGLKRLHGAFTGGWSAGYGL
jgi:hypothetical protein